MVLKEEFIISISPEKEAHHVMQGQMESLVGLVRRQKQERAGSLGCSLFSCFHRKNLAGLGNNLGLSILNNLGGFKL